MRDDSPRQTPGTITAAVASGVAPLPLLAVYTVIFLIHGSIKPVQPPDVTTTKDGEFVAGWISLALLIVFVIASLWLLNGKRRWPAAIMQFGVLGASVDFIVDPTKGGPLVPALLIATSLISLVCMFTPTAWSWLGRKTPAPVRGLSDIVMRRRVPKPAAPAAPVEIDLPEPALVGEEMPESEPAV